MFRWMIWHCLSTVLVCGCCPSALDGSIWWWHQTMESSGRNSSSLGPWDVGGRWGGGEWRSPPLQGLLHNPSLSVCSEELCLHRKHPLLHEERPNSLEGSSKEQCSVASSCCIFLSVQNRRLLLFLTCVSGSVALRCWARLTPPAHIRLLWFGLLFPGCGLAFAVKPARSFPLGGGYGGQTQSGPCWSLKLVPQNGMDKQWGGGFCAVRWCLWAYLCRIRKKHLCGDNSSSCTGWLLCA